MEGYKMADIFFHGGRDYLLYGDQQQKAIFFHDADDPGGFMCNWYRSGFVVDGIAYTSMEQYLMSRKCLVLGDEAAAARIMKTDIPANQKAIAANVKENSVIWDGIKQAILMRGLYAKFQQNPPLTALLRDTEDVWLVACSQTDKIWTCGVGIADERRRDPKCWLGPNLLGFALMEVRSALKESKEVAPEVEPIVVVHGDITKMDLDCVVNAANRTLFGGKGVDAAINKAAGPKLRKEYLSMGGCRVGEAKITKAYNLPCKWVIHTVGPTYDGSPNNAVELGDCYRNCLDLAMEHNLHAIAFPAISTGFLGYPLEEAAHVAIDAVRRWRVSNPDYDMHVTFCCFDTKNFEAYKKILPNAAIVEQQ